MTSDPYLDIAYKSYWDILERYKQFEDKKPIMLLDIQEKKIYVYPHKEFIMDLNEKSHKIMMEQYQRAISNNQMVVFIRDNKKRKLVSFSLDIEDTSTATSMTGMC